MGFERILPDALTMTQDRQDQSRTFPGRPSLVEEEDFVVEQSDEQVRYGLTDDGRQKLRNKLARQEAIDDAE